MPFEAVDAAAEPRYNPLVTNGSYTKRVGTLFPKTAVKNLTAYVGALGHKIESAFPASKGELKAENAALEAQNMRQDAVITNLVNQVNSLTPVRDVPCIWS